MGNNDSLVRGSRLGMHCPGGSCLLLFPRARFVKEAGASWQCVPGLEPWNEEGCDE